MSILLAFFSIKEKDPQAIKSKENSSKRKLKPRCSSRKHRVTLNGVKKTLSIQVRSIPAYFESALDSDPKAFLTDLWENMSEEMT